MEVGKLDINEGRILKLQINLISFVHKIFRDSNGRLSPNIYIVITFTKYF